MFDTIAVEHDTSDRSDEPPKADVVSRGLRTATGSGNDVPLPDHRVHFYGDEKLLVGAVAQFVGEGLRRGEPILLLAIKGRLAAFCHQLALDGHDVERARRSEQLVLVDARELLEKIMRNGEPDVNCFDREVGHLFGGRVDDGAGKRLRVYGELVDILWASGRREAAIGLEALWNRYHERHSFSLLCAYAMAGFYHQPSALERVCSGHAVVSQDPPHQSIEFGDGRTVETGDTIRSLAREVAQRKEVEAALRKSLRELSLKENELRRSEEQWSHFADHANLGLCQVAPDGTILWANRAQQQQLGRPEGELLGCSIGEFLVDPLAIEDLLARIRRGEDLEDCEVRLRAKDGTIRHVLLSSSAYFRDAEYIHTRCFMRDITEHRTAQQALRSSEQQLQTITDALPVLVAYVDTERRYRFVNAAHQHWFGHGRQEIEGRRLDDVLGREAYETIRSHVDRVLAGDPVTFEAVIPYRKGGQRFVEVTYIPQFGDDGRVVGFVALEVDITARKSFEHYREAATVRAERLLRITAGLADAVTPGEVHAAVVDRVAGAVGASTAGLWLVDESGGTARLVRSLGYREIAIERLGTVSLDLEPPIPALEAIRRRQPVWWSSQEDLLRSYPHLGPLVTPGRSYRVCSLPLIAHGRALGALLLTFESVAERVEDDAQDFLHLVAQYASQALERLRLLDAERHSRSAAHAAAVRMGVLSQASRALVETKLELGPRLRGVVTAVGIAMDSAVEIVLVDADGVERASAIHHPIPGAGQRFESLGIGALARIADALAPPGSASEEGFVITSLDPESLVVGPQAHRFLALRHPFYAAARVPLRVAGRTIGILTAFRVRSEQTYSDTDFELFDELASRAAVALENSRLYQETVDAHSLAEHLYRFAQVVVTADRVEQVLEAGIDAIEGALAGSRAAILAFDGDGEARFRAWHGLSAKVRSIVERHSSWPTDDQPPQPVLVPDVESEPRVAAYRDALHDEGIRALAVFPVVNRGRVLGNLMIFYGDVHAFSLAESELASTIANHLGSVIARFAAVAELQSTIRDNELFAGVLAHDLRNPLGAMMTAAELIRLRGQDGGGKPDEPTPLDRIVRSGRRMTRMIDQLLDFTRIRAGGGIRIEPRLVNLAELCAQVIGELQLTHPQWSITRDVQGEVEGMWDPDRLLQALSNLVANAGQHGKDACPISIRLDGLQPDVVKFEVHNEGAIPASLQANLFDPFRTRRADSRGLGLGLYIVKEIVVMHGGTIDVASSDSSGTTFIVYLPRHARSRFPTPAEADV